MKRQRQGNLKLLLRQLLHSRDQSAGGYRHIALTDIQSVLICKHTQKHHKILIIIHGFTGSHNHHIGDPLSGDPLNGINLVKHLGGTQIAFQSIQRGGAETTAHPAAYLRGNTDTVAVPVLHPYTLHHIAVRQTKKKLLRSVYFGLLDFHHGQLGIFIFSFTFLSQIPGEIRHLLKASGKLHMHPLIHLFCVERLFPCCRQFFHQHGQGHGLYIFFLIHLIIPSSQVLHR